MKKALPKVFARYSVDYCIANVENAAGGFGVTKDICDEILDMGVDCMTSGNHIWDKSEILGVIDLIPQLLRPLNYPARQPGPRLVRRQGRRRAACRWRRSTSRAGSSCTGRWTTRSRWGSARSRSCARRPR
jgi:calcineurin-like phosphoesterase